MTPSYLVPPITQHYYPAHQGLILLYLKVLSQQRRQSNFNHASGPAQVQRLYCSLQRLEACCYIYSPVDISIIYCGLVLWYQNRLCPCPWLLSKPQASSYNVRINKYWQISGLTKTLVQEMYCLFVACVSYTCTTWNLLIFELDLGLTSPVFRSDISHGQRHLATWFRTRLLAMAGWIGSLLNICPSPKRKVLLLGAETRKMVWKYFDS